MIKELVIRLEKSPTEIDTLTQEIGKEKLLAIEKERITFPT